MIEYSISKNHFQLVQTRATIANQKSVVYHIYQKKVNGEKTGRENKKVNIEY